MHPSCALRSTGHVHSSRAYENSQRQNPSEHEPSQAIGVNPERGAADTPTHCASALWPPMAPTLLACACRGSRGSWLRLLVSSAVCSNNRCSIGRRGERCRVSGILASRLSFLQGCGRKKADDPTKLRAEALADCNWLPQRGDLSAQAIGLGCGVATWRSVGAAAPRGAGACNQAKNVLTIPKATMQDTAS